MEPPQAPQYLIETYGINPCHALDEAYGEEISLERYNAQQAMLAEHPYYKPGKIE
jgi:hypothetical protein